MVDSCFFCQNLLSDFEEELLPKVRHSEIRAHLKSCESCQKTQTQLKGSLEMLSSVAPKPIPQDLALQVLDVVERSALGRSFTTKAAVMCVSVILLSLVGVAGYYQYGGALPGPLERTFTEQPTFSRYYPLFQGATDILEEQSSWVQMRDSFDGSLWEDGGVAPEEFERSFQIRQPRKLSSE